MIDLYTWSTPNGWKASIMLEELGLAYTAHPVNIGKNEQFQPAFLAINPNSKIPAIVDHDGPGGGPFTVFESGAILIYLAEKTKSPLLPAEPRARSVTLQWLMFQMGGVGPMFGQAHHFLFQPAEVVPYAQKRYGNETRRLYGVLNQRLGAVPYLAGPDYSIADIATWPWVSRHARHGVDLAQFANVRQWFETIEARPSVRRGITVP